MRAFSLVILLFTLAMSGPVHAGPSPVPARRLALTRNLDFQGTDIAAIFNTTESACERTCLADSACRAFTYNTRANACFTKSAITRSKIYKGAISGRVMETDPALLAAVPQRAAELGFLVRQDFAAARAQALRLADDYVTN